MEGSQGDKIMDLKEIEEIMTKLGQNDLYLQSEIRKLKSFDIESSQMTIEIHQNVKPDGHSNSRQKDTNYFDQELFSTLFVCSLFETNALSQTDSELGHLCRLMSFDFKVPVNHQHQSKYTGESSEIKSMITIPHLKSPFTSDKNLKPSFNSQAKSMRTFVERSPKKVHKDSKP